MPPTEASLINESEIVGELENDENIRYFKLPENNGWNNGRALLISQVQTEYFVWCDDDWIFHDETNLETMLVTRDSRIRVPREISQSGFQTKPAWTRMRSGSWIPVGYN